MADLSDENRNASITFSFDSLFLDGVVVYRRVKFGTGGLAMVKLINGGGVNLSSGGLEAKLASGSQSLAELNNGDTVDIENLTIDLSLARAILEKRLQEKDGLDARFTAIMELVRQTRQFGRSDDSCEI
jgi:hypothetical protein